jgi:DNA-binding response OmpR family regulator
MSGTILIVDDEEKIRSIVTNYLKQEGFKIDEASNGQEALQRLKDTSRDYDLVVLDWMMPGISGLEACRKIREFSEIPILFLTAKTDEVDKLVGLEIGADDFITKPFSLRELAARIRVILRRMQKVQRVSVEFILVRGEMAIDLNRHIVKVNQEEVVLTPTEFKLLHTLASSPGRVYSRLQLLTLCLGEEYAGYERSIDTHISNLRKKIEKDPAKPTYIVTVFGIGYKFGETL